MRVSSVKVCIASNVLQGIGFTLLDEKRPDEEPLTLGFYGQTAYQGCEDLPVSTDDKVNKILVYYSDFVSGMQVFYQDGRRVNFGLKQTTDRTLTWDFTSSVDSGFKIIGLRGSTDENDRLTSFQLIVYDRECGLASVVDTGFSEESDIDGEGSEAEGAVDGDLFVLEEG